MTRCILERMWCDNWHSMFETCERNYSVQADTLAQDPTFVDRRLREWSGTQDRKCGVGGEDPRENGGGGNKWESRENARRWQRNTPGSRDLNIFRHRFPYAGQNFIIFVKNLVKSTHMPIWKEKQE